MGICAKHNCKHKPKPKANAKLTQHPNRHRAANAPSVRNQRKNSAAGNCRNLHPLPQNVF